MVYRRRDRTRYICIYENLRVCFRYLASAGNTIYDKKICRIKFSPIAHPLYWGKIFAKFNFANRVRSTLQEVVGGGRAYRIMRVHIRTYGVPRSTI